jgi:putative transposase
VLAEAVGRDRMRLLADGLTLNPWHLLLWPAGDGDLSRFVRWLTLTHTQRWHAHHHTAGSGHLDQGRFKSFPVQSDAHFGTVCRSVERNAVRAGLVARAEVWRWGSLWRAQPSPAAPGPSLSKWPVERPADWVERVNRALTPAEEESVRRSLQRGQPFGDPRWQTLTATRLGLGSTLQPRGRPRKKPRNGSCHENDEDWLGSLTRIAHFHHLRVPQGGMTNCSENNCELFVNVRFCADFHRFGYRQHGGVTADTFDPVGRSPTRNPTGRHSAATPSMAI